MRRRPFLHGVGTLFAGAITGCVSGPTPEPPEKADTLLLEVNPVTNAEIAKRLLGTYSGELRQRTEGTLTTTVLSEDPPVVPADGTEPEPEQRAVYEGNVYRFTSQLVARNASTSYEMLLTAPSEVTDSATLETVQFSALPPVDKRQVKPLLRRPHGSTEAFRYTGTERATSRLVPYLEDGVILESPNRRAALVATDKQVLDRYRIIATLTESAETAGKQLRERYAITLSSPSPGVRRIFSTATAPNATDASSGVDYKLPPEATPTSATRALVETLQGGQPLSSHEEPDIEVLRRTYLVEHEGSAYLVIVTFDTSEYEREYPTAPG